MTKDEALTKWCPFARASTNYSSPSVNRDYAGGVHQGARCLADGCSLWIVDRGYNQSIGGHCGMVRHGN